MSREDELLEAVKNIINEWNNTHFHMESGTVTLDRIEWRTLNGSVFILDELVFEIARGRK